MADLKLSPTRKHYRIGDKDDYVVLDGARVIGRIFHADFSSSSGAMLRQGGYSPIF